MKLYLAGNPGHGNPGRDRESYIIKKRYRRILSFFWCREEGDFHKVFLRWNDEKQKSNDKKL